MRTNRFLPNPHATPFAASRRSGVPPLQSGLDAARMSSTGAPVWWYRICGPPPPPPPTPPPPVGLLGVVWAGAASSLNRVPPPVGRTVCSATCSRSAPDVGGDDRCASSGRSSWNRMAAGRPVPIVPVCGSTSSTPLRRQFKRITIRRLSSVRNPPGGGGGGRPAEPLHGDCEVAKKTKQTRGGMVAIHVMALGGRAPDRNGRHWRPRIRI